MNLFHQQMLDIIFLIEKEDRSRFIKIVVRENEHYSEIEPFMRYQRCWENSDN
jgi:hypothetical protein